MLPLHLLLLLFSHVHAQYTPEPRWGQAAALVNNGLFVFGGKTDTHNGLEYTTEHSNSDLLYLPLDNPFQSTSPPWKLVSSASIHPPAGPPVAWHTLSAFTNSDLLLFGGMPDTVLSPSTLYTLSDSAWLLNIRNPAAPEWTPQNESWAAQPIRRIHHSSVSAADGQVYIFGGEKADGSRSRFAEHVRYDPRDSTFHLLPTDNGPPDLTGQSSLILDNGTLLVFGGLAQESLLSLSTIWSLDTTQANSSWITVTTNSEPLPLPRRAFAATTLGRSRILIHGGSDGALQEAYDDGWILDLSQTPPTWQKVDALSVVGRRKDHLAFAVGDEVLFGFGYGLSSPADAGLIVYDAAASTTAPSFTPLPTSSRHQTVPDPTMTPTGTAKPTASPTSLPSLTASVVPNDPEDSSRSNKKTTAIAVGAAFGVLGFLAGGVIIVFIIRRRRREHAQHSFIALQEDAEREGSLHIAGDVPLAGTYAEKHGHSQEGIVESLRNLGVTGVLALFIPGRAASRPEERRDMLADEDNDLSWYEPQRRGSSWSVRSFLSGRAKSREPSGMSLHGSDIGSPVGTPWLEKGDPFSDGAAMAVDGETGFIGAAVPGSSRRPQVNRRQQSYASSRSGRSYVDPFADPIAEENHYRAYTDDDGPSTYPPPNLATIQTMLPYTGQPHTLSPVTESSRTQSMLDQASSSSHTNSQDRPFSPFDASNSTSRSSQDINRSPRPSSMFDPAAVPNQPIRRSDSWWAKFSRTSFLDRRSSDRRSRTNGELDFRDPNPPPRLMAIEETNSASPEESPGSRRSNSIRRSGSRLSKHGSKVYGAHGKSMSSIRTADSEAIERMANTMDVVQHARGSSARTRDSVGTSASTEDGSSRWTHDRQEDADEIVASPTTMEPGDSAYYANPRSPRLTPSVHSPSPAPSTASANSSNRTGNSVAERVQNYEKRVSIDVEPPPTNTKQREERPKSKVGYGLVPRASLYVANPDRKGQPSDGST